MQGEMDCEGASRIVINPFDPARRERSGFSCGTERPDNFLRFRARKQRKDDIAKLWAVSLCDRQFGSKQLAMGIAVTA